MGSERSNAILSIQTILPASSFMCLSRLSVPEPKTVKIFPGNASLCIPDPWFPQGRHKRLIKFTP